MQLEFKAELDGVCIKKITIFTEKNKTIVQILELREDTLGKSGWLPVHLSIHDTYLDAKAKFIGLVTICCIENCNQTSDILDRENLFIRGSLPTSLGRRIRQA